MKKFPLLLTLLWAISLHGDGKNKLLLSRDVITADDLAGLYKTSFVIKEESNPTGAPFLKPSTVTYESPQGASPKHTVTVIFRMFSNGAEAYEAFKLTRGQSGPDFDLKSSDGAGVGETSCFTGPALSLVRGNAWLLIAATGTKKPDEEMDSRLAAQALAKMALARLK